MKIAYILPSLINTGPTIVIHTLIQNLIDLVEKIDVYYFDEKKSAMNFSCSVHKIDFNTAIDFGQYDIVHSNMYRPDKYVAKWKDKTFHTKTLFVSTIHQDIFQNLKYSYNVPVAIVFNYFWKKYLKKMDVTAVISNKLLSIYLNQLPQSVLVYNGVDIEYDYNAADPYIRNRITELKSKGFKVLGTYAAINKRKGIDQLLSVLNLRNDIALVIIGEGEEKRHLEEFVSEKKMQDRVLFFPYLNRPYNYLAFCDAYAMPSRSEGFGLAMVEAALTHTPVLCSDIDVFREIFDDSQVAFFKLNDIQSLNTAIDKIFSDSELFVQKAYSRVKKKFTGKIMAYHYFELYKSILK